MPDIQISYIGHWPSFRDHSISCRRGTILSCGYEVAYLVAGGSPTEDQSSKNQTRAKESNKHTIRSIPVTTLIPPYQYQSPKNQPSSSYWYYTGTCRTLARGLPRRRGAATPHLLWIGALRGRAVSGSPVGSRKRRTMAGPIAATVAREGDRKRARLGEEMGGGTGEASKQVKASPNNLSVCLSVAALEAFVSNTCIQV